MGGREREISCLESGSADQEVATNLTGAAMERKLEEEGGTGRLVRALMGCPGPVRVPGPT